MNREKSNLQNLKHLGFFCRNFEMYNFPLKYIRIGIYLVLVKQGRVQHFYNQILIQITEVVWGEPKYSRSKFFSLL